MNPRILIAALLWATLTLGGCVAVPVPTKEDKVLSGRPVTEEQIAFLTPKVTTKQEVIEQLGNPNIIWEDARVFVYNWEMRQGVLFWAAGATYSGAVGAKDIPKYYLLLIQFDDQERVLRFERTVRPSSQPYAEFLKEWIRKTDTSDANDPKEGS
jgi:outer membrane protein assembly factor BamE (lipoprotein component of BamABCDE complex)